jgi:hypothetical protein
LARLKIRNCECEKSGKTILWRERKSNSNHKISDKTSENPGEVERWQRKVENDLQVQLFLKEEGKLKPQPQVN